MTSLFLTTMTWQPNGYHTYLKLKGVSKKAMLNLSLKYPLTIVMERYGMFPTMVSNIP